MYLYTMLHKLLKLGYANPKKLFLIDGIGAILSVILLLFLVGGLHSIFGIPTTYLHLLAIFAVLFAFFDFYIYFKTQEKHSIALKIIVLMNIFYCFISIGVVIFLFDKITIFGMLYLGAEILIIAILSSIELKVSSYQKNIE